MIQQELSNLKSLVPIVKRIEAGEFKTAEEIIIHLHLLSNLSIGESLQMRNVDPMELETRINLLLRFAEYPETKEEYESCSPDSKKVQEKAKQVLMQLITGLKPGISNSLVSVLSFETIKKISAFYSKIENLPRGKENQLRSLKEFFEYLYNWPEERREDAPSWLSKEDKVRDFLVDPMIAIVILYLDNPQSIYFALSDKYNILKKLDYFARGIFRINNPCREFSGPQYPDQNYFYIVGYEMVNYLHSSDFVIRAASAAYWIKESKSKK